MSRKDIHLTTKQYDALMMIDQLSGAGRIEYIRKLVYDSSVAAAILSVSVSGLGAKVPYVIDDTDAGICNVSKVLEMFLEVALNHPATPQEFNDREVILFNIFNSPLILGVSSKVIEESCVLPEVHLAIPHLLSGRGRPVKLPDILVCGVCHRPMRSVDEDEGLCTSCKGLLSSYTKYRAEAFYLPVNHLNVPTLTKKSDKAQEVLYIYDHWIFRTKMYGLTAEPTGPKLGIQFPLPIPEYQRTIS